jgi:two-component system, chemotaxis family, protein-glutamate methylesterase/glutaminase
MKPRPRRVLIVDDSALVRKMLSEIFSADPELEVVGTARDPYEARELIKQLEPDVVTLDVEMPRMDGLSFLHNLMRLHPLPVVMVSSLTEKGADATLAALQYGAVDFVAKPHVDIAVGLHGFAEELTTKVKAAALVRVRALAALPLQAAPLKSQGLKTTDRVIAIGASTGGTEAISDMLKTMPPDAPGMVIAQHIPEVFSARFAARLDQECALVVREARDGAPLLTGHAYVAPGGKHLRVERSGAKYFCVLGDDDPVNRHRPSVDVLFESVAHHVGRNAVGVLLTGMGADGAEGLLSIRQADGYTLAQDRETSVVWGMPGEAVKRDAACEVLPVGEMTARTLAAARGVR